MLRDGASSSWGLAVHFEDADGRAHDVSVPAEVYGDPNVLATLLMSEGLRLADAAPKTRVRTEQAELSVLDKNRGAPDPTRAARDRPHPVLLSQEGRSGDRAGGLI